MQYLDGYTFLGRREGPTCIDYVLTSENATVMVEDKGILSQSPGSDRAVIYITLKLRIEPENTIDERVKYRVDKLKDL